MKIDLTESTGTCLSRKVTLSSSTEVIPINSVSSACSVVKKVIDWDLLKQELSDHIVEGAQERYHLDWPGKREALLTANKPIARTLRPVTPEKILSIKTISGVPLRKN